MTTEVILTLIIQGVLAVGCVWSAISSSISAKSAKEATAILTAQENRRQEDRELRHRMRDIQEGKEP